MPAAFQRGPCDASRWRNAPHEWVDCGDQPSSAMAGSRGNAMNSMSADVRMVSVHSGASTPRTADAGTPDTYAPGFQPYAFFTSVSPAQSCPSGVCALYFMSRYAWLAGDSTSLVPCFAAAATAGLVVVVSQNSATVDGSGVALTMSCQPSTALPCLATMACTLLMNAA